VASSNSGVARRGEEEAADEMGGGHEGGRRDRVRETDELNYDMPGPPDSGSGRVTLRC
jgi:hypothetical protein